MKASSTARWGAALACTWTASAALVHCSGTNPGPDYGLTSGTSSGSSAGSSGGSGAGTGGSGSGGTSGASGAGAGATTGGSSGAGAGTSAGAGAGSGAGTGVGSGATTGAPSGSSGATTGDMSGSSGAMSGQSGEASGQSGSSGASTGASGSSGTSDSGPDGTVEAGPDTGAPDATPDATPDAPLAPDSGDGSPAPDGSEASTEDASDGSPHDALPDMAAPDARPDAADAAVCTSAALTPTAATASSVNGTNTAAKAIDNDFGTRWESTHGVDPQWLVLDFGAPVYIDRVRIAWDFACAADYQLEVSDLDSSDAAAWTPIATVTGNTAGTHNATGWTAAGGALGPGVVDRTGLSGVGRYLRVYGTTRCTAFGYSIWEIQAFGDTDAACTH